MKDVGMSHWAWDGVFYHIYPLGLCDAPHRNDFHSPAEPRLEQLHGWLDHLQDLGVNALYLGPVFESSAHGYDTADYVRVDRRLGTNDTLKQFSDDLHARGMRLVLDGVFNHVGRDFWAFRHVRTHGERSIYRDWFHNLRFGPRSPNGDPFTYEGWDGHYDLVKLNLHHPAVRKHLLDAVTQWVREFNVDGLRLDAADVIDLGFLRELATHCRTLKPDFWLMGEVVHGDYRRWVGRGPLDSVTNYECYKGLYSSHVDANYFEIAYAFNRQFGSNGLYRDIPLYAFADNHDVNRVASNLTSQGHLYPLYALLFTMPGVPSLYYGSEWGLKGQRTDHSDRQLRPALDLATAKLRAPQPKLPDAIRKLAHLRHQTPALRHGNYAQVHVDHEQLVFARQTPEQGVLVAVNAAASPVPLEIKVPHGGRRLVDLLNPGEEFPITNGRALLDPLPPCWARVLQVL